LRHLFQSEVQQRTDTAIISTYFLPLGPKSLDGIGHTCVLQSV
jgi:hypothetical protein